MITASTIPFVVIFHPWISIGQDKHVSVCSCIIIATSAGQDYTLSIIPLKLCRFVVATLSRIHRTRRLHLSREWVARSWYWVGVGLREIVRRRKRENKERISMLVTGARVSFGSANIAQLAPFKVRIFWRNASWRRLWLCFSTWWKLGNSGGERCYLRIGFSFSFFSLEKVFRSSREIFREESIVHEKAHTTDIFY